MEAKKTLALHLSSPLYREAEALGQSVAAIRTACGKKNPHDFEVNSPEWHQVFTEFANDVLAALGGALDNLPASEFGYEREAVNSRALKLERSEPQRKKT